MIRPSFAKGQAPVSCPICAQDVEDAIATVGRDQDGRGRRYDVLDGFECPAGHNWNDLSSEQERVVLDAALSWLSDAREALEDAYWDARYQGRSEDA